MSTELVDRAPEMDQAPLLERIRSLEQERDELCAKAQELDHIARERPALMERVNELETELAVVPSLRDRLDAALDALAAVTGPHVTELRDQNDELIAEVARLKKVMYDTYRSFSWRLTVPLRKAKRLVRR